MKNFIFLIGLILFLGACDKQETQIGPDLTASLAGQYMATYIIHDLANNPGVHSTQTFSGGSGLNSVVQLIRKNNNALAVSVKINDSTFQINDHFDVTVSLLKPNTDYLRTPVMYDGYKLTNDKNTWHIYLSNDGKVMGGFAYESKDKLLVHVYF